MPSNSRNPFKWANELHFCYRCNAPVGSVAGDWPIYGRLALGYPSTLPEILTGRRAATIDDPLVERSSAQEIALRWSNTTKTADGFTSTSPYLCRPCQREFLITIGRFFKWLPEGGH